MNNKMARWQASGLLNISHVVEYLKMILLGVNPSHWAIKLFSGSIFKYKRTKTGLVFSALFISLNLYRCTHTWNQLVTYIENYFATCFQKNFCLTIIEVSIGNIHPLFILYLGIAYKIELKIICLEQAAHFVAKLREERRILAKPSKIIIILHALLVTEICSKIYEWPAWYCLIDYYCQAGFIFFDCLVMFLFYIVKETYAWINYTLNAMTNEKNVREDLLRELEEIHWHAGDLCDNLNNCFAIHLLLFWPYNIIHTITFLIDVSDYFKVKTHSLNTTTILLEGCIRTVIFLVTIVYFSRTGTLLNKEVQKTKVYLEKLKLHTENNLSQKCKKLIRIFSLKLNSRKVSLKASNLIELDMKMIQSFFGLLLTYWIVLVQFRST